MFWIHHDEGETEQGEKVRFMSAQRFFKRWRAMVARIYMQSVRLRFQSQTVRGSFFENRDRGFCHITLSPFPGLGGFWSATVQHSL